EHRFRGRQGRQPQCLGLQRVQGRRHRPDQVIGQRTGGNRNHGQLHNTSRRAYRHFRPDDAGAHRLHAVQDSHETLRQDRRDRRSGGMAMLRRLLLLHGRHLRHLRRKGDLLMDKPRYSAETLRDFSQALLEAAGMPPDPAEAVADTLVEGDLLGHDTHGLALLAPYIKEIENKTMEVAGLPDTLSDRGASLLWDGRRLPGPWLVHQGLDALIPRAREFGSATLVIRRSHHIACLAAYLLRATENGLLITLASSDPAVASVAPYGGTQAVFT